MDLYSVTESDMELIKIALKVLEDNFDDGVLLLANNGRLLTELPVQRVSDIMSTF